MGSQPIVASVLWPGHQGGVQTREPRCQLCTQSQNHRIPLPQPQGVLNGLKRKHTQLPVSHPNTSRTAFLISRPFFTLLWRTHTRYCTWAPFANPHTAGKCEPCTAKAQGGRGRRKTAPAGGPRVHTLPSWWVQGLQRSQPPSSPLCCLCTSGPLVLSKATSPPPPFKYQFSLLSKSRTFL